MDLLLILAAIGAPFGACVGALVMRDRIRRGRTLRRRERLVASGTAVALPDGRVPCPECAEAIRPEARRCPFCRQVVVDRI